MTIVADTSPICYLLLVEQIQILPALFGQITIPLAVRDELLAEGAADTIQSWIAQPPDWLAIQPVVEPLDDLPATLGQGEREAIGLAVRLHASLIVLDDLDARKAAQTYGLNVTGLLGVLYRAGLQGLLNFPETIACLQQTSFRFSPVLIENLLKQYQNRQQ